MFFLSKVIYLYNQDHLSAKDKVYSIILNFFKSIGTNLIIHFFNYFFDDSMDTNDCVDINSIKITKDKNSYIPIDYSHPSISFLINGKFLFSIEILNNVKNNFTLYLLKYNIKNNSEHSYNVNLPEVRILEFENKYTSLDKYDYVINIYNHTLSYEIPVFKFFNYNFDFLKDNKLYILCPFSLFTIYNKITNISKIGFNPSNLKNEVLSLSRNTYKNLKNIYTCSNSLNKNDYLVIKNTIGEIVDYYLDCLCD